MSPFARQRSFPLLHIHSYSGILCLSMALAAVPRCGTHHDIVAIFFFAYRELERRRAGLGCAWGARSARAELEQNCAFDGAYAALEEQRPEWSAVRASIRTLATYGGRRCRAKSGEAAERSIVAEGGWKTVRSTVEAFLAVFRPFRGASMH